MYHGNEFRKSPWTEWALKFVARPILQPMGVTEAVLPPPGRSPAFPRAAARGCELTLFTSRPQGLICAHEVAAQSGGRMHTAPIDWPCQHHFRLPARHNSPAPGPARNRNIARAELYSKAAITGTRDGPATASSRRPVVPGCDHESVQPGLTARSMSLDSRLRCTRSAAGYGDGGR
jgi:hypothetical protein